MGETAETMQTSTKACRAGWVDPAGAFQLTAADAILSHDEETTRGLATSPFGTPTMPVSVLSRFTLFGA